MSDLKSFKINIPQIQMPKIEIPDLGDFTRQFEASTRELNAAVEEAAEAREAYKNEILRSLHAIESNTANLYTIVDLINKSNEQQDELIAILVEILSIAKAKSKEDAASAFAKVMAKITQVVKDGETLAKVAGYAMAVYQMVQPLIDNVK